MTVLIEDQASGTQLIHELVADGLYAVTRYQPQSALTSPIDLAIPGLCVRHQASCARYLVDWLGSVRTISGFLR